MKSSNHITSHCKAGFTLLELMVVIVLLAFLVAIAIPSINALSGTDIKNEVTRVSGLFSEIYDRAAISGVTHRVTFDFENQTYWAEEKVGEAGVISPELGYEEIMKDRQKHYRSDEEKDKLDKFLPNFKAIDGELGEKHQLKNAVIYGVWTEQMPDVARSGIVSIYFFSGGYTQVAFVSIAKKGEESDTSIYIALSPLTGRVEINVGEPEVNQLLDSEKETK